MCLFQYLVSNGHPAIRAKKFHARETFPQWNGFLSAGTPGMPISEKPAAQEGSKKITPIIRFCKYLKFS
jgi:hypothetical protein